MGETEAQCAWQVQVHVDTHNRKITEMGVTGSEQPHHSLNCVFPHRYTLVSGFFKFSEKQPNLILPLPGVETMSSLDLS